jgi:hypothetical protein
MLKTLPGSAKLTLEKIVSASFLNKEISLYLPE